MIGPLALVLLCLAAPAQAEAPGRVLVEVAEGSGGRLTIELLFQLGAAEDPPGRAGLTHLAEHLALGRSARAEALEAAGGEEVGLTTHDAVRLTVTAPPGGGTLALGRVSEILASGAGAPSEQVWRQERERALQEALADRFSEAALRGLALYPPGHPYHRPAAGLPDDLEQIRASDASDWLATALLPALAHAAVSGASGSEIEALQAALDAAPALGAAPARALPDAPRAWPRRWWCLSPRPAQLLAWALPAEAQRAALEEIISRLNNSILNKYSRPGDPILVASAGLLSRRLGAELVVRAEPAPRWWGRLLGRRPGPVALDRLLGRVRRGLAAMARGGPEGAVSTLVNTWLRPERTVTLSLGPDRAHWPKEAEELPTR